MQNARIWKNKEKFYQNKNFKNLTSFAVTGDV